MYARCKAWLQAHGNVLILALLFLASAAFLLSGRENVHSDGNRTEQVRRELESAKGDNGGIQERVGEAKKAVDNIEESVKRSGELADEAESIVRDCQYIIEEIRKRGEKDKAAYET